jgi:hypothetical protein
MKQTTTTTWGFAARPKDIDIARILEEAPTSTRVVRVEVGMYRMLAIRSEAYDRIVATTGDGPCCPNGDPWLGKWGYSPIVGVDGVMRDYGGRCVDGWHLSVCTVEQEQQAGTTIDWLWELVAKSDEVINQPVQVQVQAR